MKRTTLDSAIEAATLTVATVAAAIEAPAAAVAAAVEKITKIVVSLKGNHDIIQFDGKAVPSREAIKKLSLESGIIYQGRNSNAEKCVSCSPNAASVHWMHVSFNQNDVQHDTWICEGCGRAYPSKRGMKNFKILQDAKK